MAFSDIRIILNPQAAKGKVRTHKKAIEEQFHHLGVQVDIVLTNGRLDAIDLACQAVHDGCHTIVAAGGDGTVNEVVNGVVKGIREKGLSFEHSPAVGLIPIGRGNDFAYFATVPKEVDQACLMIAQNTWHPTDYGELFGGEFPQGRCFINGVGIGFEPMVNYVASSFKRISGMASYLLGFLQVLLNYPKAVPLTITTEKEKIVLETQQISVCNGRRMGSTFIMGPKAEVDDGLLDVVYANTPIAGSKILWYALKFFSGTQLKSKKFSMIRSDEVKIEAAEDLLVCHADGEGVSQGCRTIEVKLYKNGLKFIRKRETVFD